MEINICFFDYMKIYFFGCLMSDKGLNEIVIYLNGLCVNIVIKDKYKDIFEELKW